MLKNKTILILVLLLQTGILLAQKTKTYAPAWPGVNFSYAKVYLYNLDNQLHSKYHIVYKGNLNPTVVEPSIRLEANQTKNLLTILNGDTRILNEGLAKCYEPHHGIVFYNEKDSIVAATDICFLCEGIRFYPAKKYYSALPDAAYSESSMKKTYKQIADLKQALKNTGIPVYEKQLDYELEAKKRKSFDTLTIQSDSIFSDLFKQVKNIPQLKKMFYGNNGFAVDSTHTFTGGGDKVTFYSIKFDNGTMEASSYEGGDLWIVEYNSQDRNAQVFPKLRINMMKYEVFELYKKYFNGYFYNNVIQFVSQNGNQKFRISFNENNMVSKIYYYSYH